VLRVYSYIRENSHIRGVMVITYHGDNYFKIQSGSTTVLIDPTNSRSLRGADVVVNTVRPTSVAEPNEEDNPFWIDHQGEYDIGEVRVRGWDLGDRAGKEKTIVRITLDGIDVVVMGSITEEPGSFVQERLGGADIVILPAGGKPLIALLRVAKLVRQIEPGVVIPSLFKNLKPFLKEFNQLKCPLEEKLVFKKKDIKPGAMEVRCLKG